MITEEPLIYTSKGNVLQSSLTYEHQWVISEEAISLLEFWRDETGELVKNNVHMYSLKGLPPMGGVQAQMQ